MIFWSCARLWPIWNSNLLLFLWPSPFDFFLPISFMDMHFTNNEIYPFLVHIWMSFDKCRQLCPCCHTETWKTLLILNGVLFQQLCLLASSASHWSTFWQNVAIFLKIRLKITEIMLLLRRGKYLIHLYNCMYQ